MRQAAIDVGTVRLNAFPDSSTRVPKLDIELFYFFGKINMYVNLVPRANLVSMAWLHELPDTCSALLPTSTA